MPLEQPAADPVSALVERHRLAGVEPDPWTLSARWERESEIPATVLFRAYEALAGEGSYTP